MKCPSCKRPTQLVYSSHPDHIPGIIVAPRQDGTCQRCYRKTLKPKDHKMPIENIDGALRGFLTARRRRGVPPEGFPVEVVRLP